MFKAANFGIAVTVAAGVAGFGAAAAADGSVVVYTANDSVLNETIFNEFTEETGIEVLPVARRGRSLTR